MTIKLYVVAGIALCGLASCSSGESADYIDKSLVTSTSQKVDTTPAVNNVVVGANNPAIPGMNTVSGGQTMQFAPGTPATTTAPGMNPPHGQPGHRCDIADGAPLNSKPAPATAQPTTVNAQPAPVTIKEVPTTTKTAPGMNPPHGEPGHRCDITVGAPLNSKPAPPATATAAPTTTQAVAAQPSPVTVKEVPTTTKTAPGMNPPHGEPGHKCEIAVGAPLNSKPTTPAATTADKKPATPPLMLTAPKNDSSKN